MRRHMEALKADVRWRMGPPPQRQDVAAISQELGVHVITLYEWHKTYRLQGDVVLPPRWIKKVGPRPTR